MTTRNPYSPWASRQIGTLIRRSCVASALLTGTVALLAPMPAHADSSTVNTKIAGVYRSSPRVAGKTGPLLNVSLGADGSATVTEEIGEAAATLFGHWVDNGSQVTVTFDAAEGESAEPPMVFEPTHDGLQAASWNHAIWGKEVPPPLKKGSRKVKEIYWFDTVR